jgi:ABC-type lipoprotein export system ATPase subunit
MRGLTKRKQRGEVVDPLHADHGLPVLLSGAAAARRRPGRGWARRLGGFEHRRFEALSGGQAQYVALARGLVTGREVVFDDEPTG